MVDVNPEVSSDFLIYPLCLSICLWVIGGGWISFDSQHLIEGLGEFGHELGSPITDDIFWHSIELKDVIPEDLGISFCCEQCVGWDHMGLF